MMVTMNLQHEETGTGGGLKPPDGTETEVRATTRLLYRLAVAFAEADTVLAGRLGLGPSDYLAMKHLMTSQSPLGPAELGKLLGISSGSATGLVDRLERAGHIQRRPHPGDRRRLVIQPTPAATQRFLTQLTPLADALDRLAAELTPPQQEIVERFLTQAIATHQDFCRNAEIRGGRPQR